MDRLLEKLSNAFGISGDEKEVRELILREIRPYVDEVKVDGLGNLICRKSGKGPPLMLAAHMDEIGLMVREIDNVGRIFFSLVGGISEKTLVAQPVHILAKERIHGVITYKKLETDTRDEKYPSYTEMYVDTGLTKKALLKKGVRIGTVMIPERKFTMLGDDNTISGKALDDRIGCYILIALAKRMKKIPLNIYYVFTVQEEMGLYGAKTSIYSINPVWALVVDTSSVTGIKEQDIGHGPCIILKDVEFIANKHLSEHLIKAAEKRKIPYQRQVLDVGTTDAIVISISKGGIPTAVLSVPIRNIHSPVSIASMNDVENSIELLGEFLKNPPKKCV